MSNKRITFSRKWRVAWHVLAALVVMLALLPAAGGAAQAAAAPSSAAADGEEAWSRLFVSGGPGERVYALAMDGQGILYAGGSSGVAQWDGSVWSPVGAGMNGPVNALATDALGNLFAGGAFTTAGGVTVNHIAKWNGTKWSPLGSGMNGPVRALVIDTFGVLYAGGEFTSAGGMAANYVAKWDGHTWSLLGSGIQAVSEGGVAALAVDSRGHLYAGGRFASAGGAAVQNLAKWNGSQWSHLTGWDNFSIVDWPVTGLAVDESDNLYTAVRDGGYVGIWNGSAWSAVSPWDISTIDALVVDSNGDLYVTGSGDVGGTPLGIARWDGNAWSGLSHGIGDEFFSLIEALLVAEDGTLYAGGFFNSASVVKLSHVAKWDGKNWSALGGYGIAYDMRALATGPVGNRDLYIGGHLLSDGYRWWVDVIAHWDGFGWSILGSIDHRDGTPYGNYIPYFHYTDQGSYAEIYTVHALAADSSGNLYAGGTFRNISGVAVNRIAKWDGNVWSPLGSGMNGPVYALVVDGSGNVYAGGGFTTAGGVPANHVAKWDGSAWSALGGGVDGLAYGVAEGTEPPIDPLDETVRPAVKPVYTLALDGEGNLYADAMVQIGPLAWTIGVARWDGSTWSTFPVSGGLYYDINSLAVDGSGNLYAALISDVDLDDLSVSGVAIARWDGSAWSVIATEQGPRQEPYHLTIDSGGNLVAGGWFTSIGGVPANHIARWDGTSWSSLGSGVDYTVYALAADGSGGVYASGGLTSAGGKPSQHIARWGPVREVTVSVEGSGGRVISEPFGISCGALCTETFDSGLVVTLAARPDTGSIFTGWGGDCSGAGVCTLTMDGAKQVTATFRADNISLRSLYLPRVSTKR